MEIGVTSTPTIGGTTEVMYGAKPILRVPGSEGGVGFEADHLPPGLEPTHMLVGVGNYYTPVPVEHAKYTGIAILLGLVVLVLVLLAWGFDSQRQAPTIQLTKKPKFTRRPPRLGPNSVVGTARRGGFSSVLDGLAYRDEVTCSAVPSAYWTTTTARCRCRRPYWGPDCRRETVQQGYLPVGAWDPEVAELQVVGERRSVPHLSFNMEGEEGQTCTELCDLTEGCAGVLWEPSGEIDLTRNPGVCTLLTGVTVRPGQQLAFDPQSDGNLFLRDPDESLHYTDRVYIYSGRAPVRWWLYSRLNVPNGRVVDLQLEVLEGRLYNVPFFPSKMHGGTQMTGLYGLQPWDREDFERIVGETTNSEGLTPDNYYVQRPGQPLQVPLAWYGLPMWVMYATRLTSTR